MEKDPMSKALDVLVINAGAAVINSRKVKESSIAVELPLALRPSVLKSITEMLDLLLPKTLEGKMRQEKLTESLSLFLSDVIDSGLVCGAFQKAGKQVKK